MHKARERGFADLFGDALDARRRRRHMSRLELAISVIIVGVLIGVVAWRANKLMVKAEQVSVMQVAGQLRAALGLEVAARVARGHLAAAAGLAASNPMDLLQVRPANYLGVLSDPDPAQIRPGNWYFDSRTGYLVYRVQHTDDFETVLTGPARAEFVIRLRYRDGDGNGRYNAAGDTLYGVDFVPAAPFRWVNHDQ